MGYNTFFASAGDLEQQIASLSLRVIAASALILIVLLTVASLFANKKHTYLKKPLFILIVAVILSGTATLFTSTIYLNTRSYSKGPVHWHADIEFWACDVQLEIRNPSGFLSNKIGTSTLHEHNDQRIHLEGVVVDKDVDATLGKFIKVMGGSISNDSLNLPVADSILEDFIDGDKVDVGGVSNVSSFLKQDSDGKQVFVAKNGSLCPGEKQAELQVFVYKFNKKDNTYEQTKLENPSAYMIRDESIVPPGDCIIVEYSEAKARTNRLCEQYGVRDVDRCTEFGVSEFNPKVCYIRELIPKSGEL